MRDGNLKRNLRKTAGKFRAGRLKRKSGLCYTVSTDLWSLRAVNCVKRIETGGYSDCILKIMECL